MHIKIKLQLFNQLSILKNISLLTLLKLLFDYFEMFFWKMTNVNN